MTKWIVMFVCALTLTACGSMHNAASSGSDSSATGSSGSSANSSGYSGQSYADSSANSHDLNYYPGAWGTGTFGDSGP